MTPEVDQSLCFSSGECILAAPKVFAFDADGLAVVIDPTAAPDEDLARIAEQCPSGAISLRPAP